MAGPTRGHSGAVKTLGRPAEDPGDLLRLAAGAVVVEDERGPLVRRELGKSRDQPGGRLLHLVPPVEGRWLEAPAIFQLSGGDPKGRSPDPALRIAEIVATTEGLGERLGHGVARHLSVAGEGRDGDYDGPLPGARDGASRGARAPGTGQRPPTTLITGSGERGAGTGRLGSLSSECAEITGDGGGEAAPRG
jgi:hypothetical protein